MSESILRRSLRRPFSGFSLRLRTMIVRSRISCSCSRDNDSALFEETAATLSARSISSRAAYARIVARKHGHGRAFSLLFWSLLFLHLLDMEAGVSAVGRLRTARAAENGWKFIISTTPSWRSTSAEQLS